MTATPTPAVQELWNRFRQLSKSEQDDFLAEVDADSFPSEETPSPQWHADILRERERLVEDGSVHYIPWEQAKQEIREAIGRR